MSDTSANPAPSKAARARNPVEKWAVRGLIGGLAALLAYEGAEKHFYDSSLSALKEALNDEKGNTPLFADVQRVISGSPSVTDLPKRDRMSLTKEYRWHSFFKEYRMQLTISSDKEPVALGYSTPLAEDESDHRPDPQRLAQGNNPPPAATGMMMMGGGAGPMGGGPMGGGAGPMGGGGGQRDRSLIGLALRDAVSTEIALNEEQQTKLKEQQEKNREAFQQLRSIPEADRPEAMRKMQAEVEAFVKSVLTDEQMQRVLQVSWREAGLGALEREDLGKLVQITDEQRTKIVEMQGERRAALRELGFPRPEDKAKEINTKYDGQIKELLSEQQFTDFEKALGPEVK